MRFFFLTAVSDKHKHKSFLDLIINNIHLKLMLFRHFSSKTFSHRGCSKLNRIKLLISDKGITLMTWTLCVRTMEMPVEKCVAAAATVAVSSCSGNNGSLRRSARMWFAGISENVYISHHTTQVIKQYTDSGLLWLRFSLRNKTKCSCGQKTTPS